MAPSERSSAVLEASAVVLHVRGKQKGPRQTHSRLQEASTEMTVELGNDSAGRKKIQKKNIAADRTSFSIKNDSYQRKNK